jgi:hypothetical protein
MHSAISFFRSSIFWYRIHYAPSTVGVERNGVLDVKKHLKEIKKQGRK